MRGEMKFVRLSVLLGSTYEADMKCSLSVLNGNMKGETNRRSSICLFNVDSDMSG